MPAFPGRLLLVIAAVIVDLITSSVIAETTTATGVEKPPNIVLILADDLGFSDTEPYGSEIKTPAITVLAEQGAVFTNYHSSPSCAPSRAMLLTGVDSHRNGVPNMTEALPPAQTQHANYQGVLSDNVVTVATLLQDKGYHTYMAGKWHLGKTPEKRPFQRGFAHTLALMDSGADNWQQKPYIPVYDKANWTADGKPTTLPEDFYSSEFLVDKMIEFIGSNQDDARPFFAYLPFQAMHIPVQAPKEYTERYLGMYDKGWDAIRAARHTRAKQLGIVPPDSKQITMSTTNDWDSFNAEEQRYHAKRMAVYAGMLAAMDHHIGRLVQFLKSNGQYDNTVFIFTSDNGPEASGNDRPQSYISQFNAQANGYHTDYETLGEKGSYNTIGPSFASAAAAPFSHYKFYMGEGGIRVPLIIAGTGIPQSDEYINALTHITDITPTILALSQIEAPTKRYAGKPIKPIIGKNLLPLLNGEAERVYQEDESIGMELAGNAALFQGDYKIVLNQDAATEKQWRLFNIVEDPGETHDLAAAMPQRLHNMLQAYKTYVSENNVLPIPEGYITIRQIAENGLLKRFGTLILVLILTLLSLLVLYIITQQKHAGAMPSKQAG